jgi:hypothetical protein
MGGRGLFWPDLLLFSEMRFQGPIAGGRGAAQLGLGGLLAALIAVVFVAPVMLVLVIVLVVVGIIATGVGVLLKLAGRVSNAVRSGDTDGRKNVRVRDPGQA